MAKKARPPKNTKKKTPAPKPKPKPKGRKLDKGESLYTGDMAERARRIILDFQPLLTNGELAYAKIARGLGVSERTFRKWRNPKSQDYKPELPVALAEAYEQLIESIDLGKTKRAMIARSQPHKLTKKIREPRITAPKIPALGGLDKEALRECLKKLNPKLKIDRKWSAGQLKLRITEQVEAQTTEKMVVVRIEEQSSLGNSADGKHVTANIGPVDKRWIEKAEIEAGKNLADFLKSMKE